MINVKEIVDEWKAEIKSSVDENTDSLTIFQVGDNPASNAYIKGTFKDCEEMGIKTNLIKMPENVCYDELAQKMINVVYDTSSNIMLQLPIPFNAQETQKLLDIIPHNRDVDALSSTSKRHNKLPCTPKGILYLIDKLNISLVGKNIVMIGRSNTVGKPLADALLDKNATVTICHSHTPKDKLTQYLLNADVVISAVGKQNFITKDMVNDKSIIIDVGISRDENGKLCGDCDKELYDYVENITPVPRGVSLLTRCALLDSIINK